MWERTAQGHLETFKNMETRLIESNFSMRRLPLLSHFCIFMIMIMIMIMIRMMNDYYYYRREWLNALFN